MPFELIKANPMSRLFLFILFMTLASVSVAVAGKPPPSLQPMDYEQDPPGKKSPSRGGKSPTQETTAADANSIRKDRLEGRKLVDTSSYIIRKLLADRSMPRLHRAFPNAKAVMVFPSILRGGFIIGGKGGNGVLSVRRPNSEWSPPTFYTLGGVSFGAQIGFGDAEVIFTIMTERGLKSILSQRVKLGADVSVAAGPVGLGSSVGATATLADIYSYSMDKGLYVGLNLEGNYIHPRRDIDEAYYGRKIPVEDILFRGKARDALTLKLIEALNTTITPATIAEPQEAATQSGGLP